MGCGSSSEATSLQPSKKASGIEQPTKPIQQINSNKISAGVEEQPSRKHIMLSYQHNNQPLVLYVYEFLQKHNIRLWMDVRGGMEEHLLDSEAAAVESSSVVVCFLTQKYQDSKNCKDEFKYAKKKDKPIIPCLIDPDWKPTGWLDMGIGDSLYVNFSKAKDFNYDPKCQELLERIKAVDKTEDYFIVDGDIMSTADIEREENPNYDAIDQNCKFDIPSSIHEGPQLTNANTDQINLTKHVCEGDSPVRLLLTGKLQHQVYANQETFARNGKFINYFFISKLIFQNTSEKPLTVLEITAQYEHTDGKWHDCDDVKISPADVDEGSLHKWLPNTTLNLEPSKAITFAVRVDVQVNGEPGYDNQRRARAHRTLSQPFKIRIHLQDIENKSVRLIVEQLNEPLEFPTKDKLIKTWNYKDIIAFIYADDCNDDTRYWQIIHCEDQYKLRFSFGNDLSFSETKYLEPWLIKQLYNQAKKNRITQIPIDDWNNEQRINTALFDKTTFNLYAIRIELRTTTSKTIETILLPLDKIKEAFEKENSSTD